MSSFGGESSKVAEYKLLSAFNFTCLRAVMQSIPKGHGNLTDRMVFLF